jgi:hypothetical protein
VVEIPHPREWIRSVGLQLQLPRLPDALREPYADAVLARITDPAKVNFVRLDIEATRPPD